MKLLTYDIHVHTHDIGHIYIYCTVVVWYNAQRLLDVKEEEEKSNAEPWPQILKAESEPRLPNKKIT